MILGGGELGTSAYGGGNKIATPPSPLPPAVVSVLSYYAGLLILQYRTKTKAQETIKLLANQSFSDGFVFDEMVCFDLDTAIGAQLDILGRIVGVPRTIYTFDPTQQFFNFTDYNGDPAIVHGFGDYTDNPFDPGNWQFYNYDLFDATSVQLVDDDMRKLIKMKIELNNNRSTFAFINSLIFRYLNPDVTVVDNKNMHLMYSIKSTFGTLARAALFLNMLPVPAGVSADYVFV